MSEINFSNLDYEAFRSLAKDEKINQHERVGFPSSYREDKDQFILDDILSKLQNLKLTHKKFLEIGPGWSDLTHRIINYSAQQQHEVVLVDSPEMLALIPDFPHVKKISAKFPEILEEIAKEGPFDAILTYSVIQYPFFDGNMWNFIDAAASLLAPEGQFLIGDIPNTSMRKRFLASPTALAYHKKYHSDSGELPPQPVFNKLEPMAIDDGVMVGIFMRLRLAGFHVFILPQDNNLPMSNRREDILVVCP
ncbi:MAG: class I SAM-dependent methyltransferase [Caedimonadaceae bacterium]|nr:MAG: class I SAM-dependent methyltransferase [Caedimonadaceae bacterium]